MMAATSDERSVMEPGKTNSGQSQPIDRLKLLYPMVDEEKTPLPRSWSTKDKYSYIGLSQNNLRVHYKGTWVARQRATSARARRCASFVARTRVCASSVRTSAPRRGPSGRPSPASCLCCVAPRLGCSRGRHGRSIENGRALFQRVSDLNKGISWSVSQSLAVEIFPRRSRHHPRMFSLTRWHLPRHRGRSSRCLLLQDARRFLSTRLLGKRNVRERGRGSEIERYIERGTERDGTRVRTMSMTATYVDVKMICGLDPAPRFSSTSRAGLSPPPPPPFRSHRISRWYTGCPVLHFCTEKNF